MAELLIYGRVKLIRSKCEICDEITLGPYCCKSLKVKQDKKIEKTKRISKGISKRRFSSYQINLQLEKQEGKCFWCSVEIHSNFYFASGGKLKPLKVVGDHIIPYCYDQDSSKLNLVASCNVCNSIKSSKIFDKLEEMRSYILEKKRKREEKLGINEI